MQKSWIQKYPTLMTRFYPMGAGKRQSAFRNWTNALLPKAHFETGSMRFYPMAAGECQSAI
jgi:hypothetical protein